MAACHEAAVNVHAPWGCHTVGLAHTLRAKNLLSLDDPDATAAAD